MATKTKICFVCLGNIVRSPLAENMFAHLANEAGVGHKYEVDSAGTGAWHVGERPDPRMRQVAARNGLEYDGRARQFEVHDFDEFDLIIAMDHRNRENLSKMAPSEEARGKIHIMREFDPDGGARAEVPDPYYGGWDGFEKTFKIIQRSVKGLLDTLEDDQQTG